MACRFRIALFAAVLGAALCVSVPSVPAQGRGGMHGSAPAPHARSFRPIGRGGFAPEGRRRLLNDPLWFPYSYPWDDYDDDYAQLPPPEAAPVPLAVAPVVAAPTPAAPPAAPLLLEKQNGQWVRVPTGNELPVASQPVTTESTTAVPTRPGFVELPQAAAPATPLPPAVIVYRDGHTEEVAKYMIQGTDLYTSSDYYSTGAWTRKIPLSQLDIPASLRLNKERGTKFNLPSSPNEVVIRF
jgi:hypothetical protein